MRRFGAAKIWEGEANIQLLLIALLLLLSHVDVCYFHNTLFEEQSQWRNELFKKRHMIAFHQVGVVRVSCSVRTCGLDVQFVLK
jgi:hypothetical protein